MEDLGIALSPITKLRLYRAARDSIFAQMEKNKVTPEHADEILSYVKKYVVDIETPELAKKFIHHLGEKFSELKKVEEKFQLEESEKIDRVLVLFLDEFIQKNEIDLATEIMSKIEDTENIQAIASQLKEKYPREFEKALAKMT